MHLFQLVLGLIPLLCYWTPIQALPLAQEREPYPTEPPDPHPALSLTSIGAAALGFRAIWLRKKPEGRVPNAAVALSEEYQERKELDYQRLLSVGVKWQVARCTVNKLHPDDGYYNLFVPYWTWDGYIAECEREYEAEEERLAKASQEQQSTTGETPATQEEGDGQRIKSENGRSEFKLLDKASTLVSGVAAGKYQPPQVKVDMGSLAKGAVMYASKIRPTSPKAPIKLHV
ncbi:MAG: hypothetical protein M1823_000061 [Watsoniomyces obsoletus]|nr:MAG: hypothetical protein M1823_000061 [Watsoniomyces obsoletus]